MHSRATFPFIKTYGICLVFQNITEFNTPEKLSRTIMLNLGQRCILNNKVLNCNIKMLWQKEEEEEEEAAH